MIAHRRCEGARHAGDKVQELASHNRTLFQLLDRDLPNQTSVQDLLKEGEKVDRAVAVCIEDGPNSLHFIVAVDLRPGHEFKKLVELHL